MNKIYEAEFVTSRWASKSDVFELITGFAVGYEIVEITEKRKLFKVEYKVKMKEVEQLVVEKIVEVPVEVEKIVEKVVKIPTVKYVEKDRLGNVIVGRGKSRFRGVCKKRDRFYAMIQVGGKKKWLGSFTSEFAAAEAYDTAAKMLHGDKAKLNFNGDKVAK